MPDLQHVDAYGWVCTQFEILLLIFPEEKFSISSLKDSSIESNHSKSIKYQ